MSWVQIPPAAPAFPLCRRRRRDSRSTDNSMRIAGQTGLSRLYHYQDFNLTTPDFLHVDRLIDILSNHRIYCSNPADFLDDPVNRAATAESFIANQRGGPKGSRMDEMLRTNPEMLKQCIHILGSLLSLSRSMSYLNVVALLAQSQRHLS